MQAFLQSKQSGYPMDIVDMYCCWWKSGVNQYVANVLMGRLMVNRQSFPKRWARGSVYQ